MVQKRLMRIRLFLTSAALLGGSFVAGRAHAQGVPGPAIGDRVRLEIADSVRRVTGTVAAHRGDTITVETHGEFRLVNIGSIERYELSVGRDRPRGARRGALVGGALGLALLVGAAIEDAHSTKDVLVPGVVLVAPLAVGITALGAGVGAIAAPERWETRWARSARRPSALRVGLALSF